MAADCFEAVGALIRELGLDSRGDQPLLRLGPDDDSLPLPHPDATFACAVIAGPLERSGDPVGWVRETRRVITPGGLVLAVAPAPGRWSWDDPAVRRPYTRKALRLLFADMGLEVRSDGHRMLWNGPEPLRRMLNALPVRPRLTWVLGTRP